MSALQELSDYIDQHRQRLYDALHTLINWSHADGDCPHNPADCLEADYETTLKQIDRYAVTTGQPWHIGLAEMVRISEKNVQQIKEEGVDE